MPQITPIRPDYAATFHCIGSACEDTCCQGWSVPIDRAAYEKYQSLPPSPLHTLIDTSILLMPATVKPPAFARIRMDEANQCPLLSADRLCRIQSEVGEPFLSHACATYPRVIHAIGSIQETALTLSCPEAARLVLLNPDLPALDSQQGAQAEPLAVRNASQLPAGYLSSQFIWFWPIRQVVLLLLRNRAYPLWQRLFLLGVFCRRLDAIATGELKRSVPDFLKDFAASVASGALLSAMETLPLDREAQLDIVLRLAGMLLHRSNLRPRFLACVQAFTAGIGNGPGATIQSLAEQYAVAHDRYYAPFFDRHPYILENFLTNTVLRCRFPFAHVSQQTQLSMTREFALLTAQFALMKGLLIGVAGHHREAFAAEHVVHTVQAASKHFEHHPEFLNLAHELLVESRMDGARGLAILLRNTEPKAPRPAAQQIPVPPPHPGVSALVPVP
jgi:lysine-N-methylase